jgi:hypothetical protein
MSLRKRVLAVLLCAIGMMIAVPFVVLCIDAIHDRSYQPDRVYMVEDAQGDVIGHAHRAWAMTVVHFGLRQDGPVNSTNSDGMLIPSWASVSIPPPFTAVSSYGFGWPWRWLVTRSYLNHHGMLPQAQRSELGGVVALGLFCNIIFYIIVACGLMWLADKVRALRAARKLRRQLCPKCKYSLIGLTRSRCPECGNPIRTPRTAT